MEGKLKEIYETMLLQPKTTPEAIHPIVICHQIPDGKMEKEQRNQEFEKRGIERRNKPVKKDEKEM